MSKKLRGTKCSINKAGGLRRVMLALVVLLLAATLLVGTGSAVTLSGEGTETNPFLISTAQDLKDVRDAINVASGQEKITRASDNQLSSRYAHQEHYKLTTDIDLNNEPWTPIWRLSQGGAFDGAGHTIKNLYINTPYSNNKYGAFISGLNTATTISNLNFTNVKIVPSNPTDSFKYAGVLIAFNDAGLITIENCHVDGLIEIEATDYAGGIIGYTGKGTTITMSSVKGSAESSITSVKSSGGIVGFHGNGAGSIEDCKVSDVEVSAKENVGGLIGSLAGCEKDAVISGCEATAKVSLIEGSERSNYGIGGLIGRAIDYSDSDFAPIEDCNFAGSIAVDSNIDAKKVSTGLVGTVVDSNSAYNSPDGIDILYGDSGKVSGSAFTLTPESASGLVTYFGEDTNTNIIGSVEVKDESNNVVLVEGLDQTIVTTATDGTTATTTVTWTDGKATISGATVDDSGNIKIGDSSVVTETNEQVTSTSDSVKLSSDQFTCTPDKLEFGELTYGYSEPEGKSVTIATKDGSEVPAITKIDSTSFDASFSGAVVTVTPKTGLDAGNHKEPVTILLTGGVALQITANVTVTQAEQTLEFEKTEISKSEKDAAFTNEITQIGDGTISYTSSDETVATVDENGKVTIVAAGTTTITATAGATTNYKEATAATYTLKVYASQYAVTGTGNPDGSIFVANEVSDTDKDTINETIETQTEKFSEGVYWLDVSLLDADGNPITTPVTFTVTYADILGSNAGNAAKYNFFVLHLNGGTVEPVNAEPGQTGLSVGPTTLSPFAIGYSLKSSNDGSGNGGNPNANTGGSSTPQGSSVWLTEPLTPTPTETAQPTPTDSVPTDVPTTQPTPTETQSPLSVLAVLGGLGAVAVLRRK